MQIWKGFKRFVIKCRMGMCFKTEQLEGNFLKQEEVVGAVLYCVHVEVTAAGEVNELQPTKDFTRVIEAGIMLTLQK